MQHGAVYVPPPIEGARSSLSDWPVSQLTVNIHLWEKCTDSEWVLRTLRRGYRLQFTAVPPSFRGIIQSHAEGQAALFLKEEISSLLEKKAIRLIQPEHSSEGFYSRYFLVPKKGGRGMRAILDLRALNRHLRKYRFKMLTNVSLLRFLRPGDWFTSIDLKDAYFHIPIYPPHRKYLRFSFHGNCYEYLVLPFGLSLSPRVFVKCTEAAVGPLRRRGIRVATYIDDWLIASSSHQEASLHTAMIKEHLMDLGFKINLEKSSLFPSQRIAFIGLSLDSIHARVSKREPGIIQPLQEAAGADGRSISGDPSGTSPHERNPTMGSLSQVKVTYPPSYAKSHGSLHGCTAPMAEQRDTGTGCPNGSGAEQKGCHNRCLSVRLGGYMRTENGERNLGSRNAVQAHKLLGAEGCSPSIKAFPSHPESSPCADQNRQHNSGGLYQQAGGAEIAEAPHACSQTNHLEQQTLPVFEGHPCTGSVELWSRSSLQGESHVCRVETPPRCGEDGLAAVRSTIRGPFCFSREQSVSPVLLPARSEPTSGGRCASPPLASHSALCVSPNSSHFTYTSQGTSRGSYNDPHRTQLASEALVSRDNTAPLAGTMVTPCTQGSAVSGTRTDFSPPPRKTGSMGLAREWFNLQSVGLPQNIIETIQDARAPATRSLYGYKWSVFEKWCSEMKDVPFQCSLGVILAFLQSLIDKGKAFSTIKVYLAAISACHIGFEGKTVGQHPLVCRFMRGARRKLPVSRPIAPSWDLPLVLDALTTTPFEPLDQVELKVVALKTALLLALVSAKRVGEIHALSVHPSCMKFSLDGTRVVLLPNPAFEPKVLGSYSPIELMAFHPPPFSSQEQERLHSLCPVRALRIYVRRTIQVRKSDQLFVSWAKNHNGKAVSKQRLAHWITDAISLAYSSKGHQPPEGLRAHSTRGLSSSWALLRGVSLQEICAAASWASSHTFTRFYKLDVTAPSLAHSVLSVTPSREQK
ncbi:uncharacterized protein LOC119798106 [Cyprinodon tularosa]|uniref:uncharacterized protein LOC119798106 n=1 Tax=Cyprinodon tularosa TaxID=77115 RepID=UPI0018E1DF3E|nr:uncharacterized protein LOC119798106 [Cyprinodon tularosa]